MDVPHKKSLDRRTLLVIPVMTLGLQGISGLWFMAVELGLNSIPAIAESTQSHSENGSGIETQPYIWVFLSVVVVGPLVEELLFRGIVFHYAEKIKAGWLPILLSGLAFGLWHKEPVQCVYAAIAGIALGIIYARMRNLKVVLLIYIRNNFLSTLPPIFNTEPVSLGITGISYLMVVPTIMILVRMNRARMQETAPSHT